MIEWWLDCSAYPRVLWALLRANDHGEISVLDVDGRLNEFDSYEDAAAWLREDEYECLDDVAHDDLRELGIRRDDLRPPEGASYELLIEAMQRAAAGGQ